MTNLLSSENISQSYGVPIHPGHILDAEYLKPQGLSVAAAAAKLGVTRQALYNLASGKARMSVEMALRLESLFGRTARYWLILQVDYDLAETRGSIDGGRESGASQLSLLLEKES